MQWARLAAMLVSSGAARIRRASPPAVHAVRMHRSQTKLVTLAAPLDQIVSK